MKKIIPIILFFLVTIASTVFASSFEANENNVKNDFKNDTQKVENGAEAVKNTAGNIVRGTGNVVEGAGNAISEGADRVVEGTANVIEKAGNGIENAKDRVVDGTQGATKTARETTVVETANNASSFLGMSNTAWVWTIMLVVGAALIILLTKYMKDKDEEHAHD